MSILPPILAETIIQLVRFAAQASGGDPDKAECAACQRHPELRHGASDNYRKALAKRKKGE